MLIRTRVKTLLNMANIQCIRVEKKDINHVWVVADTISNSEYEIALFKTEADAVNAIDYIKEAYIQGYKLVEFEESCIKRD